MKKVKEFIERLRKVTQTKTSWGKEQLDEEVRKLYMEMLEEENERLSQIEENYFKGSARG
jgi:ElaB/YqjD/DUF883 family membrane-anchored ribosome-binding protein